MEQTLPNATDEARAQALFADIRCLTCQAQSIADSEALLAQDLRQLVRSEIAAGRSDAEIEDSLRGKYGDRILMQPPLAGSTALLWGGPFLLLLLGLWLATRFLRGRA